MPILILYNSHNPLKHFNFKFLKSKILSQRSTYQTVIQKLRNSPVQKENINTEKDLTFQMLPG